jgi:aryl sulfotransferase
MARLPQATRRYDHRFFDSERWRGFRPRADDVFVCTAYKAGTTWMQMICALLILGTPRLDRPLGRISPWIERETLPIETVLETLEAQSHRRFIKTHTPLDGLPFFPGATYVFVGRDPRDVFLSMRNHILNAKQDPASSQVAGGGDWPEIPDDIGRFFRQWMTTGFFPWEKDGWPSWSMLHHALTFWEFRHLPNLHFFHYADMLEDLDREMRRVAGALDIAVDEARWPELVAAASFDSMRSNAEMLAPGADRNAWHDTARFFNKGSSGQWRGVLGEGELALYDQAMAERLPPPLHRWLERGGSMDGV